MSETTRSKRWSIRRIIFVCTMIPLLWLVIIVGIAFFFRSGTPPTEIPLSGFAEIVREHRLAPSADGMLHVRLVTEEGKRARPPRIEGLCYPVGENGERNTRVTFRAYLPTEADVAAFQSLAT